MNNMMNKYSDENAKKVAERIFIDLLQIENENLKAVGRLKRQDSEISEMIIRLIDKELEKL